MLHSMYMYVHRCIYSISCICIYTSVYVTFGIFVHIPVYICIGSLEGKIVSPVPFTRIKEQVDKDFEEMEGCVDPAAPEPPRLSYSQWQATIKDAKKAQKKEEEKAKAKDAQAAGTGKEEKTETADAAETETADASISSASSSSSSSPPPSSLPSDGNSITTANVVRGKRHASPVKRKVASKRNRTR
jgi:hypothetical protein